MLPNSAIHSAIPLVQALNRKGLNVVPVENSPLAALVKATRGVEVISENGEPDLVYIASQISSTTNSDDGALPNEHNMIGDEIFPELGKLVRGHVSYAKNVVSPAIEHLVQETTNILNNFAPSSLLGMEISIFKLPKIFKNSALISSLDEYRETKFEFNYRLPFDLPVTSGEDLRKLIEESTPGLGKDLEAWVGELGISKFEEYFTTFFTSEIKASSSPTIGAFVNTGIGLGGGISANMDKLLLVHLAAKAFLGNIPPGLNTNLANYETSLGLLRDMTGARLVAEFNNYDQAIESNDSLIMSTDGMKIRVYEENYKKFLDAGGENETIFGAVVSNARVFRTGLLMEKKSEYDALWEKHVSLVQMTESNKRFVRVKEALEAVFINMINEEKKEDATVNTEVVLKLFREQLKDIVIKDTECLYTLCTRLLCRSRYAHTDSEMILDGINRVMKENPKMDIRSAAAISVADYVAHWVFTLFRVV